MEDKDILKKINGADSIQDLDERISYLNSIKREFEDIKEQDISLSKKYFEDRIHNVSLKLNNLDRAYLDYILRTKIFLASLDISE